MVEYVVEWLRRTGYRAVGRRAGECYLVSAQRGDRVYVMSFARGSMADVYVAKVTIPELLPSPEWSCEVLEYSPHGYYVLEGEPGKLLSAILRKLELLDRTYREPGATPVG